MADNSSFLFYYTYVTEDKGRAKRASEKKDWKDGKGTEFCISKSDSKVSHRTNEWIRPHFFTIQSSCISNICIKDLRSQVSKGYSQTAIQASGILAWWHGDSNANRLHYLTLRHSNHLPSMRKIISTWKCWGFAWRWYEDFNIPVLIQEGVPVNSLWELHLEFL